MQSLAADEAPAFDVGCDGGDCGLLMPGSEGFYYRPLWASRVCTIPALLAVRRRVFRPSFLLPWLCTPSRTGHLHHAGRSDDECDLLCRFCLGNSNFSELFRVAMLTGVTDVQLLGPKPLRSHFQAVQQLRGRLPWYASHRTASECHCVLKMGSDDCNIPAALTPGTNYTAPTSIFSLSLEYGACPCSSIWYSTLAACAVCQGRGLAIGP